MGTDTFNCDQTSRGKQEKKSRSGSRNLGRDMMLAGDADMDDDEGREGDDGSRGDGCS